MGAALTISVGRYADGCGSSSFTSIAELQSSPHEAGARCISSIGKPPGSRTARLLLRARGHPELTLAQTFVSYMDPERRAGGHLVVSALPTRTASAGEW